MATLQEIFENTNYPPHLAALFDTETLMPLGPGKPAKQKEPTLESASVAALFAPHQVVDQVAARACISGLWLFHNFIDRSHLICQSIDTREGSYWHAMVHRREPDFWNSKYWFNRVGQHAICNELCHGAAELAADTSSEAAALLRRQRSWEAAAFVDLCESSYHTGSADEQLCQRVQRLEWHLLFAHCFRMAIAS